MREILFRGKRIDNGEWVEGFYCTNPEWDRKTYGEHHWIISGKNGIKYEVDPATVGQYTGLKDKNGKRIFEGDELSWHNGSGAVNFDGGCFCVRLHGEIEHYGRNNPAIDVIFNLYPELEVIGNIHDNGVEELNGD